MSICSIIGDDIKSTYSHFRDFGTHMNKYCFSKKDKLFISGVTVASGVGAMILSYVVDPSIRETGPIVVSWYVGGLGGGSLALMGVSGGEYIRFTLNKFFQLGKNKLVNPWSIEIKTDEYD